MNDIQELELFGLSEKEIYALAKRVEAYNGGVRPMILVKSKPINRFVNNIFDYAKIYYVDVQESVKDILSLDKTHSVITIVSFGLSGEIGKIIGRVYL